MYPVVRMTGQHPELRYEADLSQKTTRKYLTITEAADYLNVSTKTLRRWEKAGFIKPLRTEGNHRRLTIAEVQRLQTRKDLQKTKPSQSMISPSNTSDNSDVSRLDLRIIKNQLKLVQYLTTSAQHPQAQIIVVKELLECLTQLVTPDSDLRTLIPLLQQLQIQVEDYCQQLVFQNVTTVDLELSNNTMPTTKHTKQPSLPTTAKVFTQAREQARQVFHSLVKTTKDSTLDSTTRTQAKSLVQKILEPYQQLTQELTKHQPGSVTHDVILLLLTRHPHDYEIYRSQWSVRSLAEVCTTHLKTPAASKSQVGRVLRQLKWSQRIQNKLLSPDPLFGEKMKAIGEALGTMTSKDRLFFGDEFKFTTSKIGDHLQPKTAFKGLQFRLKDRPDYYYGPVCEINITGLYNPQHRQLITHEMQQMNYQTYLTILKEKCQQILAHIRGRLVFIIDNGPIHRVDALEHDLRETFGNRIIVRPLPTYSPNLNPIEGVWQQLLSTVIRNCTTTDELRTLFTRVCDTFHKQTSQLPKRSLMLTYPICHEKFNFSPRYRKTSSQAVNSHLCFNIPGLNPYTVEILTHSLEMTI